MRVGFQHMGNVSIILKALIENLGCEVVLGPKPNRKSLTAGVRHAPEMVCLPFKVTLGDMFGALECGADTLAFIGSGEWSCRFGYYGRVQCSILRKLGYRFKEIFVSGENTKSVVSEILTLHHNSWTKAISHFLHAFTVAWFKSKAIDLAEELARRIRPLEIRKGETSSRLRKFINLIDNEYMIYKLMRVKKQIKEEFSTIETRYDYEPLKIELVGESYCVLEPFVNLDIIENLGNLGVFVEPFLTSHRWLFYHSMRIDEDPNLSKKEAKSLAKPFWKYGIGGEDQVSIGYVINAARRKFDGFIHLMPFGCMPETAALPVFEKISKLYNIPLLNISLDEHTGSAGVYTRIESFLDLLQQRRSKGLR